MSESKRYGGFDGGMGISPFAGYTLEQIAARCDDAAAVARDLIAAQARIAELEAAGKLVKEAFDGTFSRHEHAQTRIAELDELQRETVVQGRAEILSLRAQLTAAEATIARARALTDALVAEADALESGAYTMTRDSCDQALDRGKAQAKREASEAIDAALSPPATSGPSDANADPAAPLAIADLPDWWDARRARLGKPDRSTCAAELRVALAHRHGWARRHRAQYPGFVLSVMASAMDRCEPQRDGLPLESYASVEVALIRGTDYDYVLPSDLGVDGFDELFDAANCNIASFVDMAKLDALRAALAARCDVALPPLVAHEAAEKRRPR